MCFSVYVYELMKKMIVGMCMCARHRLYLYFVHDFSFYTIIVAVIVVFRA